jgi:adenosylhomocysteine nucleosidase
MTKILILTALPAELEHKSLPFDFPVVFTGVGKVNAALATAQAIRDHRPDCICNYGTAGGVSAQAVGLHEIQAVIQRDMMTEPLAPRGQTPFDDAPLRLLSASTNTHGLLCATGDSFVSSADPWLHAQGVDLVDMELWGIAMACRQAGVPWKSWKYVSDNANEHSPSDWAENVHRGREAFISALL